MFGAIIIIDILLAFVAGAIAQNRSGSFWPIFLVSLIVWPVGMILAFVQPKRQPNPTYAPGWYPDPNGGGQRWYDGQIWTQHTNA